MRRHYSPMCSVSIPHLSQKQFFLKLIYITSKCVQFSISNIVYQQTGDIAMGNPLVAAMTNIFVGFQEKSTLKQLKKHLKMYIMLTLHLLYFLDLRPDNFFTHPTI